MVRPPLIHVFGFTSSPADGVRDMAASVSDALRRRGGTVVEHWHTGPAPSIRATMGAHLRILGEALSIKRQLVIWHYTPISHGYRGVPAPAVLIGLALRARRNRITLVMHEVAIPWRSPLPTRSARLRQRLIGTPLQWLAAAICMRSAHHVLLTTEARLRRTQALRAARSASFCPVTSSVPATVGDRGVRRGAVVLGWNHPHYLRDEVLGGCGPLAERGLPVTLLGGADDGTPVAQTWRETASAVGVAGALRVAGIVPAEEFSRELWAHKIAILGYSNGVESRRTGLSNALATGLAVVALDGPDLWPSLRSSGAVLVVQRDSAAVARALSHLLDDDDACVALAARGRAFFHATCSPDHFADQILRALTDA